MIWKRLRRHLGKDGHAGEINSTKVLIQEGLDREQDELERQLKLVKAQITGLRGSRYRGGEGDDA